MGNELECDLMTAYVRIGLRWRKDYSKGMPVILAIVQHLLWSRAERCPLKIQGGSGHPRRASAPEGALDADGTGADYGLRSSCAVGYAVRR